MSRPPTALRDRAAFRFFEPVGIRFSDQDSMGHVNNVSWAAYVETGRIAFMIHVMEAFEEERLNFVLANLNIDYLKELHYPGVVDVGVKLTRVGNSAITTCYGAFLGETCYATATCVNVHFDPVARVSAPIPDGLRGALVAALED